jgi:putative oxidoreductase
MKKIFRLAIKNQQLDMVLLIVRITIASFMLFHGITKLQTLFSGTTIQFPDLLGTGATASLAFAVFAEVGCSILILLGLATRLAVIPLIITMLVAAFIVLGTQGFLKQELALIYLLVYIALFFTGSGKYSLDRLIAGNNNKNAAV